MAANMFKLNQSSLSTDIASNISQPSDIDIYGLIPNSISFGRSGENVIFGGFVLSVNIVEKLLKTS